MNNKPGPHPHKREAASYWLTQRLSSGEGELASVLIAAAADAGHNEYTLRDAKSGLVHVYSSGGRWMWRLLPEVIQQMNN